MTISVIICTYNPDPRIFGRCLHAVKAANDACPVSEIIVIDNHSSPALKDLDYVNAFLKVPASSKLIVEEKQGLTAARLRGIKESTGDLIVFVDDDNELSPDFFIQVNKVATDYPFIGAFSGQVSLEFETDPPAWTKRYWGLLIHREFSGDHWTNKSTHEDCMPVGAGLCIRRQVADYYFQLHERGKRDILLDRNRNSLLSAGDNDLSKCACDLGMGMGIFEKLSMTHLIPQSRTTRAYLLKLAYGIYYSSVILKYMRKEPITPSSPVRNVIQVLRRVKMTRVDAQINAACEKGIKDALQWIEKNQQKN